MTAVYFVIAALALIGAALLLWLDRRRTAVVRRERAVWGDGHGFRYAASERDDASGLRDMRSELHRATMDLADHVEISDLTYGRYYGEEAVAFDLTDVATVVAIRRSSASSVVIDVRQEKVLAPAEEDVELLGAMGRRVMFSTHLDIARRVCDRRMVALASNAPDYIEVLWNEGNWSVASMPLTNDPVRLDTALETVRRFTDLLRVLPPVLDPSRPPDPRDPSSPTGRGRRGLDEPKTEAISRDQLRPQSGDAAASARPSGPPSGPSQSARQSGPHQQQQPSGSGPKPAASDTGRRMQPMPVRRRTERPTRLDD
ncbi:hypothetical protein [Williamsia phyllosphaerae]|uniref:Secreted protein n=1 Tax=Williamsia phyllosphaerae TaxID=885042 RepID=A0ABQ1U7M4_9NOCA|nr:hypothetical protein [Williamsia phyllosphaerae]GGF12175.1 hypothetical protein GCM10007298_05160 [Williamsia phyllosphaerae]